MDRELAVDGADVVRGAHHARQLQIVMRLKQRPETAVRLPDFEIELGPPKRPPYEATLRGVKHPVWFQPLDDVIMRRQQNDLALLQPAPGFGEGERAELGDLPVNH